MLLVGLEFVEEEARDLGFRQSLKLVYAEGSAVIAETAEVTLFGRARAAVIASGLSVRDFGDPVEEEAWEQFGTLQTVAETKVCSEKLRQQVRQRKHRTVRPSQ